MKRILSLALITVLVIQSSILGVLPLAGAQAKEIQENIYGDIEFADSEGNKLSSMEDQQVRKATVHWSIKGIDLKKTISVCSHSSFSHPGREGAEGTHYCG